jgi:DNA replication protein DnaC
MFSPPTLDQLHELKLTGRVQALSDQMQMPEITDLSFEERLGLLVDREMTARDNRRLKSRLQRAKLRQSACIEDLDYRHPRGLDKSLMARLAQCHWLREHLNVLITGPTGIGNTWIACALAQQACRQGFTPLYLRLPRFLQELTIAKADGRYGKLWTTLSKTDLLLMDDFGLAPLRDEQRHDLLEVIEDRHGRRATMLTSQLPLEHWHEAMGDPTLADAILDRPVHSAYQLTLKGDSMRKRLAAAKATASPAEAAATESRAITPRTKGPIQGAKSTPQRRRR